MNNFLGLHNTEQNIRLPEGALIQADNVQVTKSGSYTTDDESVMFLVDNGVMFAFDGNSVQTLMTGLSGGATYWCEESSNLVFFAGGGVAGYIENKEKITLLENVNSSVIAIAYHAGRLVLAIQESGQTFILMSRPYEYDTFNLNEEGFFVPDRVTSMQSINGSLIIATLSNIFVLSNEDALISLAKFGTPLGKTITTSEGRLYLWTNEGLCAFPEFQNLTGKTVSVNPGLACSTNMFEHNGSRYALVLTDGAAFSDNPA